MEVLEALFTGSGFVLFLIALAVFALVWWLWSFIGAALTALGILVIGAMLITIGTIADRAGSVNLGDVNLGSSSCPTVTFDGRTWTLEDAARELNIDINGSCDDKIAQLRDALDDESSVAIDDNPGTAETVEADETAEADHDAVTRHDMGLSSSDNTFDELSSTVPADTLVVVHGDYRRNGQAEIGYFDPGEQVPTHDDSTYRVIVFTGGTKDERYAAAEEEVQPLIDNGYEVVP